MRCSKMTAPRIKNHDRTVGYLEVRLASAAVVRPEFCEFFASTACVTRIRLRDGVLEADRCDPILGTRTAGISVVDLPGTSDLLLKIEWTPAEMSFMAASADGSEQKVIAKGSSAKFDLVPMDGGGYHQFGDVVGEIGSYKLWKGRELVVTSSARRTWSFHCEAIDELLAGAKLEGAEFQFQTILANAALMMTVSAYEVFCRERYRELDRLSATSQIERYFSQKERSRGLIEALDRQAQQAGKSVLELLTDRSARLPCRRISFQDFDSMKDVFAKIFGIDFARDIETDGTLIADVRRIIKYRHRLTHADPTDGILDLPKGGGNPIFSTPETAAKLAARMREFVDRLDAATKILK